MISPGVEISIAGGGADEKDVPIYSKAEGLYRKIQQYFLGPRSCLQGSEEIPRTPLISEMLPEMLIQQRSSGPLFASIPIDPPLTLLAIYATPHILYINQVYQFLLTDT